MGLDGLDNWIDSPMSTWVWANYYNDVLGTPFRKEDFLNSSNFL